MREKTEEEEAAGPKEGGDGSDRGGGRNEGLGFRKKRTTRGRRAVGATRRRS